MPLVLEPEAKSGFDPATATTLYWKQVPVLLKQSEREDQTEQLTFRILSGVSRQNHNLRVLRFHVSSEEDPCFLHTLEVTEEDFQALKNEQGILVDFASFPGKVITLLEKCVGPQPSDAPRFQAVLSAKSTESVFKLVETNDFKQLPHIMLNFRPGNDTAVKQFLAFRLQEVMQDCSSLTQELRQVRASRDQLSNTLAEVRQQLADLREQHDKHTLQTEASLKAQQVAAAEERVRETSALKDQFERERCQLDAKFREQLAALAARSEELDAENRKLRGQKYELDTRVSELSHKLGSAEGANKSLEEENGRLKASSTQLSAERHERDVQLNEARASLRALEEKAQAQVEVVSQQQSRIKDLDGSVHQWEGRYNDLREVVTALELRAKEAAAEVVKGNAVIEKLSGDLKLAREKGKRKQAILLRQEEEMQQQEQRLVATTRELQAASQARDGLSAECGHLKQEVTDLKAKLEDSRAQLQSNEQMIRWLNQQVTEAQLGAAGGGNALRYSAFRPSSGLGTTTSSTAAAAGVHTPAPGLLSVPTASTAYAGRYTSMASSIMPTTGLKAYTPGMGAGLSAATTAAVAMMPSPAATGTGRANLSDLTNSAAIPRPSFTSAATTLPLASLAAPATNQPAAVAAPVTTAVN